MTVEISILACKFLETAKALSMRRLWLFPSTTFKFQGDFEIYSGLKFSRTFIIQSSMMHAHWLSQNGVGKDVGKDVHVEIVSG